VTKQDEGQNVSN